MSIEAIRTTISDYIRETFQVPADDEEFTGDVHLFDYGYVDSLGAAGIIAFIEKKYGIEVTQKDLMLYSMNTVNEIAEFVEKKVKG